MESNWVSCQSDADLGLPLIDLSTPAHVVSLQQCYLGAFEGKLVLLAVSEQQQLGIMKAICYSNLVIHTKMHIKVLNHSVNLLENSFMRKKC